MYSAFSFGCKALLPIIIIPSEKSSQSFRFTQDGLKLAKCTPHQHLDSINHPIHIFKLFDWVNEGQNDMDYFRQCSCLEINPCVLFFIISLTLSKLSQLPNLELDNGSVRTKKSANGMHKTDNNCSFIREMVEKLLYPRVKLKLGLLFTSALRASVNSKPRLNFTSGTIIFHYSLMSSQYLYNIPHNRQVPVLWSKEYIKEYIHADRSGARTYNSDGLVVMKTCAFSARSRVLTRGCSIMNKRIMIYVIAGIYNKSIGYGSV